MKKHLLSILVLCCIAIAASGATKVYINPGHGSWGSNCRPMATINYAVKDTLGFFESNTNLWKAFALEEKLLARGFAVRMSRRACGGYGTSNNEFNKALSTICSEATNYGAGYFISIHSNAGPDGSSGSFANYPIFLYRGKTGSPKVAGSDKMAKAVIARHYEIFWASPKSPSSGGGPEPLTAFAASKAYVAGDLTFYGSSNSYGYLGALKHNIAGYLTEGYFHTYSPARHRALSPEWCRQEGIRYFRGVMDYYGLSGESVGYIMGYIRTKYETLTHTYYIPYPGSNDQYRPINRAKVFLRDANGNIVKTDCYRHLKRKLTNQDYYTTDHNYNGIFAYENLKPGTYTITVKANGYKTYTQTVTVTANKTIYPEIFLTPGMDEEPVKESRLNPYAYNLSSTLAADSSTITVKFSMNGTASNVKIIFNDGERDYVARSYSNVKPGGYQSTIAIDTMPTGKALTWRVDVQGPGLTAPLKSGKEYYFLHPTSVDVDDNPQSPNFGRILCNEGYHSIKDKIAYSIGASGKTYELYKSYTKGAGLYEFNPLFDYVTSYHGGQSFTANRLDVTDKAAVAPHRIRIADDGRIFVTSFNGGSAWTGKAMWTIKPESMNTWVPAFWYDKVASNSELQLNDGSFVAAPNVGLDVQGSGENLRVLLLSATNECYSDIPSAYRCYEYSWGTKAAWNTTPTKKWFDGNINNACNGVFKAIIPDAAQVQFDNEGGIWMCQYRAAASDSYPSLVYYDKNGTYRYHEVLNNRGGGGFRFNKDFTRVIISGGNGVTGEATVYSVCKDENGYPCKLVRDFVIPMDMGNFMCDFAWDYADNIYAVSFSKEKIVAWSMPYSSNRVVSTPAADKYIFTLEQKEETEPEPEPESEPEPDPDEDPESGGNTGIEPEAPSVTTTEMNPFAYALSSTLNADSTLLTINYSLNANARSVEIVLLDGNKELSIIDCDGLNKGTHSVNIPTADLPGKKTITWRVDVTGAGFTKASCVDHSIRMFSPTSVDIDNNPENENFGTVFCVEGRPDAKDDINYAHYLSYEGGAGLYVLNADASPRRIPNQLTVRYGYNGGSGRVSQTKMYFHGSSYEAYSPHRVRVSEDGRIFISSMATNGHILWETNPEVFSRPNAADWGSKTGWSRVLSVDNANTYMATEKRNCSHDYCGIYSIYTDDTKTFMAGPNVGFDVRGKGKDLKLLMLSGCKDAIVGGTSHHFYCSEYDLGEAKAWTQVPSREIFRGHVMNYAGAQVQYDQEGNVWMCQDVKNVYHTSLMKFQANGTIAYQDSVNELFRKAGAIRFNHDYTQVAIASQGSGEGGAVTIYPVLDNGMPDWTNGQEIDTRAITYTSLKDIAWDYANNLYLAADAIHNGTGQCIAVYALPHADEDIVSTPAASQYAFVLNKSSVVTEVGVQEVNPEDIEKILINGHVYIRKGDTLYTLVGARVR